MLEEIQDQSPFCSTCKKHFFDGVSRCPDDGSKLFPAHVCKIVGTIFAERYEIIEPVGEGGMSIVYKARHIHMQRIVAIKLLHERIASDEKALLRFKREAQATGNLSHQNIIAVYDFGVTKDHRAFFVMDFLDGDPLDEVIKRDGRVAPARAVNIFKQTCDGLEHAHRKSIIHRDLKPSNIILVKQEDDAEQVKIVDFGIAKMLAVETASKQNLTQTGQIVGSPLYLSPEQCAGTAMDDRSDIYSLGCLMFETLIGTPPFVGDSVISTMVKHMQEPAPVFATLIPESQIPEPIEYVVRKCLAKDPQDRYQHVAELRQSLLDAAAVSNLEGYRTGGVIDVSKSQTELASTWDKLVATMPGTAARPNASRRWLTVTAIGAPSLILLGGLTFLLLWPGPENDRGTIWNKTVWMVANSSAEQAMARQDYPAALAQLKRAETLAADFGDLHSRLIRTLKLKSQVLGLSNMYEEQETVNDRISQLELDVVRSDVDETLALVQQLARASDSHSAVSIEKARLEAEANSGRIILAARRLDGRGMLSEDEKFLRNALEAYEELGLKQTRTYPSLKAQLADCLIKQQRLAEVRPLLVSALELRRSLPDQNSKIAKRQVVESLLRLGQFDRDQSNFKDAQSELTTALDLARKDFLSDRDLMMECLQSYADLLRQTGDIEGSKNILNEIDKLPRPTPAMDATSSAAN